MASNHSIELLAIKAQVKTAKGEIESLQRRNRDLEVLVVEKECLLQDVISKFKKERNSLKSRIVKLETRLNAPNFDDTLDIKPSKGSKSVGQHGPLVEADPSDFNDSKSEGGALK